MSAVAREDRRVPFGALVVAAILSAATILPALTPAAPPAPEDPDRPADQTFLTYPEWFLVFSPDERAAYLEAGRPPSQFPYLGHIAELWESYRAVTVATRGYPLNLPYHVMISVIASSTTVEYGLQAIYESLVGRAFEALPGGPAPEEAWAARGARAYVEFIKVSPWYEFDFAHWLADLWHQPLPLDRRLPRALERRYWLTTEYAGKAVYGALIEKATRASYTPAEPTTHVVIDGAQLDAPRYQAFTDFALERARAGAHFQKIAGNDGALALTVDAPSGWEPATGAPYRIVFAQPVLTVPGHERVMLATDVLHLSETLRDLPAQRITVEHVFDY